MLSYDFGSSARTTGRGPVMKFVKKSSVLGSTTPHQVSLDIPTIFAESIGVRQVI